MELATQAEGNSPVRYTSHNAPKTEEVLATAFPDAEPPLLGDQFTLGLAFPDTG